MKRFLHRAPQQILFIFLFAIACSPGPQPQRFEAEIKKLESAGTNIRGAVLFTGSSTITKWTDIQAYFPGKKILNHGFGGSEFRDLAYYADRVIVAYAPSKIFIYEGDNDLDNNKSPRRVMEDVKIIRQLLARKLPGVPVWFISVKPSVARWHLREKMMAFNSRLKEYALSQKNTGYIDVWNPMLDKNGEVMKDLFVSDNLHMNTKGYGIWKEVLRPYVYSKG